MGGIRLVSRCARNGGEGISHPFPFPGDQRSGLVDVVGVPKHDLPRDRSQGIDRPGIFLCADLGEQFPVSGDGIAETETGSGEKFGGAAQNDQIIVGCRKRDARDLIHMLRKFHIGLIHHDIDPVLSAGGEDLCHLGSTDTGGSRVVGIADDNKIERLVKTFGKIVYIESKIRFLSERIVYGRTAA